MPPSTDPKAFHAALKASKHIIVVAGAGLSAASGIPTFRGPGGLWRTHVATDLATPEAFADDPALVWQFYHYRREAALKARPNGAHLALAAFDLPYYRNQIAPNSTFHLITQNVDGLSPRATKLLHQTLTDDQRAGYEPNNLIEMHGRLFDVLCTNQACGHVDFNTNSPICKALAGTEKLIERGAADPVVDEAHLPPCSKCGSLARPGVVWFGERPHKLDEIDDLVADADLCLVVGTSSVVFPAAGYAAEVQDGGGLVAVFNLDRSEGDEDADFLFLGPCEDLLPPALGLSVKSGAVSLASDKAETA